jgi:hypothetical protein
VLESADQHIAQTTVNPRGLSRRVTRVLERTRTAMPTLIQQQMRGEGSAERVAGCRLADSGGSHRIRHRALKHRLAAAICRQVSVVWELHP